MCRWGPDGTAYFGSRIIAGSAASPCTKRRSTFEQVSVLGEGCVYGRAWGDRLGVRERLRLIASWKPSRTLPAFRCCRKGKRVDCSSAGPIPQVSPLQEPHNEPHRAKVRWGILVSYSLGAIGRPTAFQRAANAEPPDPKLTQRSNCGSHSNVNAASSTLLTLELKRKLGHKEAWQLFAEGAGPTR